MAREESLYQDNNNLRLIPDERPRIGKFVAFHGDGSGADLFMKLADGSIFNAEGEEYTEENLESYLYWLPLPDNFKFFSEKSGSHMNILNKAIKKLRKKPIEIPPSNDLADSFNYMLKDVKFDRFKKEIWQTLLTNLPPVDGTDLENAYISKQVFMKVEHEDWINDSIQVGVLFLPWNGEPVVYLSDWADQNQIYYESDYFEHILWAEIPEQYQP